MARVAVWCSICGKGLYKCKCRKDLQARAQTVSLAYAQELGLGSPDTELPMRSDNPPEADVRRFREMVEALYGPHPADLLADALGVNIRSVQRWLAGQNRVPDAIWHSTEALLRAQSAALEKLLGRSADDVHD